MTGGLHVALACESLHIETLALQLLRRIPWGGRADASGRVALHATARVVPRPARLLPWPSRSLFWEPWIRLLDSPELVAVPCPACRCSPVEVFMIRGQRQFLWCPQCEAIWAVNLSPALSDPKPDVIAHASLATRRLL